MTWSKKRGEVLKDEIEAHIDFEIQENIEAGMLPEEAQLAAMRKFGNVLLARERSREIWGWLWAEQLWQVIHYALRGFGRNPGFAVVALLSLMLGIGASVALSAWSMVFSLRRILTPNPTKYGLRQCLPPTTPGTPGTGIRAVSLRRFKSFPHSLMSWPPMCTKC
jgi:hypothetical protein